MNELINSVMHEVKDSESAEEIFTGERFVPGLDNSELEMEHFQRYLSVCKIAEGKVVADAACGEGYGSRILSNYADKVIGIDIDSETIERAKSKYSEIDNLYFQQGSVEKLDLEDASIDVFVSFETIEHVDEKVQNRFLLEIKRVLKSDGMLIMSTPNKAIYSDLYNHHNKFHVKEFYYDEYLDFLNSQFKYVNFYNQSFEVVSLISKLGARAEDVQYICEDERLESEGKYFIALASNSKVDEDFSSVYFKNNGEYEKLIQRILTLQDEEEQRNSHIWHLDEEINTYRKVIDDLREQNNSSFANEQSGTCGLDEVERKLNELNSEKDELLHQVEKLSSEKDELLHRAKELSSEKDELLHRAKELSSEKDELLHRAKELSSEIDELLHRTKELSSEKDELLHRAEELSSEKDELRRKLDEREVDSEKLIKSLQEKDIELCNKQGHIELLLESDRELQLVKKTKSYRFTHFLRRGFDRTFPIHTRRRFFMKVLYRLINHPIMMMKMLKPSRISNYFKVMKEGGMDQVEYYYDRRENMTIQEMHPELKLDIEKKNVDVSTINDYEIIELPVWNEPMISIIIPVFNEFDYTYNCIKSIIKNSGEVTYEVIVANDCSTDITSSICDVIRNVRLISNERNLRFLLNCNNAAKHARGKYILFLNNDTQVQNNWLKPLVDLIESDSTIGMVGSKLVYPDGRLQEAGGILWNDGSAWNYGHLANADDPEYNYVKEVDYISGAAIMIRADLWKEIGGFDERFIPAYCEDSDLAFEVRRHGFKVMYQPLSVVVHFEGVSNGTDTSSGQKAYQVTNQQKFYEKWKDVLERDHFPNAENVLIARERSFNKPLLLMIDHYVPQYDKDAGSRTVFQYLRLFVDKGFNVKFIGDNFYRHEPYTTTLQQFGIEVFYGPDYAKNWREWIEKNGREIKYVFLNRPHISVKYIDAIKSYTDAKVIYYGHDLHFLRERRSFELLGDKKLLKSSEEWKDKEINLMKKSDVIYYPSCVEVDEIKKIDASIYAKAIQAYIYPKFATRKYEPDSRKDLMFVGGFGHPPNVDGVIWFANEVFPLVAQKLPDVRFIVIGSNPTEEVRKLASEKVIIKGFVTDEELETYYLKCRIDIVPLRYGAGIKGKVIEGMKFGIPLVTTSVGIEGIVGAEKIVCVEDDPKMLAQKIVSLYSSGNILTEMSNGEQDYILQNYSPDSAWSIIKEDFGG